MAADGKHERPVKFGNVSIQRNVTACAASNHTLFKISPHAPANQRIALQDVDRSQNVFDVRFGVRRLVLDEMIQDAVEIIADLWSELDSRQS